MNRVGIVILITVATLMEVAGAEPVFKTENIFPYVTKHVHGSSIVELPDNGLLACWFHGSGERSADDVEILGARLYTKNGVRVGWSPVGRMADTPGFPDCNPVLFLDANERLWLFWIAVLAHRWECSLLKYRYSDDYQDQGLPKWTWQDVITLDPGDKFAETIEKQFKEADIEEGCWAEYALPYTELIAEAARDPYKRQTGWMTRIHPLVLKSGRILLPLYSDGFNVGLVAISDDTGETWRASKPIVGLGPIQPTLVQKKDGTIVAYMRDSGDPPGRVHVSTSNDNGESWSFTVKSEIPNPGSSLEVIALKSGNWLMIFNDTEDGRYRLAAALSNDEGATWKWKRLVEPSDDEGKSFAYPSVIQTRDGLIHMTYSYSAAKGKTIRHTTINEEWVKAKN